MTWFRLPIFIWSMYANSVILVLNTPVLAITLVMVGVERVAKVGIFDPALGGDPVLFQHMFWFYSHPAVYTMVLPGMAVVSEIIPVFSRKPMFGYKAVAFSSVAIAGLSFLVWGHHMFVAGESVYVGYGFFLFQLLRGRSFRHKSLQLDRNDVSRVRIVGYAHAVRYRVHRPIHNRRHDGTDGCRFWGSTFTCTTPTS